MSTHVGLSTVVAAAAAALMAVTACTSDPGQSGLIEEVSGDPDQVRVAVVEQVMAEAVEAGSFSHAEPYELMSSDLAQQRAEFWEEVGDTGTSDGLLNQHPDLDMDNVEVAVHDSYSVAASWTGESLCGTQQDHEIFFQVEADDQGEITRFAHGGGCSCGQCVA
ncbi:MAG: hypothetical protein ACTHV8_04040 [Nesterenkonia sp.]